MRSICLVTIVLCALLTSADAAATTWTVDQDGSADFVAIQDAINAASDGDTILVDAGWYFEAIDFLGKGVEVISLAGRGATTVDGTCTGSTVNLDYVPPEGRFEGFTVTGSCDGDYPVRARSSSATIQGVVITDNVNTGGIAVWGWPCPEEPFVVHDVAIVDTTFEDPWIGLVRSISVIWCPVVVSTVLIAGQNHAGALVFSGQPDVEVSNVLVNEPFGYIYYENATSLDGAQTIRNITLVPAGVNLHDNGEPALQSNIFAGSPTAVYATDNSSLQLDVEYTDAWPAAGGVVAYPPLQDPTGSDGNISADPLFVDWTDDGDWTNDNFCLQPGSPAIDAGDPAPAFNDPDCSRNDMGAFGGPNAPDCTYMIDADGDDYMPITGDCDDGDPAVYPWAPETDCDGVDSNCDGLDGGEPCPGDDDDAATDDDDVAPDDDDTCWDDDDVVDDDDSSAADDDDSVDDDDSAGDDDDSAILDDDDDSEAGDDDSVEVADCGDCGVGQLRAPAGLLVVGALLLAVRRRTFRGGRRP